MGLLIFRTDNNTTSNHYHHHHLLLLLTLTLLVGSSSAFALNHHPTNPQLPSSSSSLIKNVNNINNHHYQHRGRLLHIQHRSNSIIPSSSSALLKIRGGSSTSLQSSMSSILSATSAAIQNGPYGILGLFGIASSVVVPLTMIRQGYSFSVGYGYSVMAMALVIAKVFGISLNLSTTTTSPISLLTAGVVFYGFRLGSFLLLREFTVASKRKQIKSFDKSSLIKRLPLALSVSLFYAFMTSPLMYAARYFTASANAAILGDISSVVFNVGVGLTWIGAIGEAIADGQKFLVKRNVKEDDESKFVGPTGGLYKLCRHPNYLFEVLHWFGLTLAGITTFGSVNKLAYVYASLGLYGIYSIMNGASKRLDTKQEETYQGQESFEKYKSSVKGSLFPSF